MTRRRGDVGRVQPAASESETDMAATIIDGKAFAATVRQKVAGHVTRLKEEHGITPTTIYRAIDSPLAELVSGDYVEARREDRKPTDKGANIEEMDPRNIAKKVVGLRKDMRKAAQKLDFERAAELRDRIRSLEEWALELRS